MRFCLVISMLLLCVTPSIALVIDQDTLWSGEKSFTEDIRVLPGATLTVAPGTTIHFSTASLEITGRLIAQGAEFSGENWQGLRLKGTDSTTRVSDCVIRGAATGIYVQGGAPILEKLTIYDNKVGVEMRGKAAGRITNCRFSGNRKVGLFIKDDSTTVVVDCRFENNPRYGVYLYRAQPQLFQGNGFVKNDIGLMIAYHGTDPQISQNSFEENNIAIQVDRAANPEIRGNLLRANQTGIYIYRRSDPLVTGNRIAENDIGLLVAYSSYPQISGNDFLHNRMALSLEFQSAAWEAQRGAEARAGETSTRSAFAGQGMRNVTEDDRRAKSIDGTVNASGNWWGEAGTEELENNGTSENPSFIHDGADQATFIDAGQKYPLDKVVYAPWSKTPLTEMK